MAENSSNGGTDVETPTDLNEPSLEELQAQLAEMEAEQSELADRLELQSQDSEPQLDHRFAVIEEQFRRSFDDRLRAGASSSSTRIAPGGVHSSQSHSSEIDVLLINRVFRDVSRLMGDEWRPVFDGLTNGLDVEVINNEKEALERQPVLIQGYKALLAWKELCQDRFNISQLVDVLRQSNMEDIAETVTALLEKRETTDNGKGKASKPVQRRKSEVTRFKPNFLDNRRILLLAKKVGGEWEPLGKALGVADEEIKEIKEGQDGLSYHGGFKMLWAWRQAQPNNNEDASCAQLRQALQQVNKEYLLEEIAVN